MGSEVRSLQKQAEAQFQTLREEELTIKFVFLFF
jgi:hypothetical protein